MRREKTSMPSVSPVSRTCARRKLSTRPKKCPVLPPPLRLRKRDTVTFPFLSRRLDRRRVNLCAAHFIIVSHRCADGEFFLSLFVRFVRPCPADSCLNSQFWSFPLVCVR